MIPGIVCSYRGTHPLPRRGHMDTLWVHVDTLRLLKTMYNPQELTTVLMDLKNSDGWLIVPFSENPLLEKINYYVIQAYNWRLN